MTPLSPHFSLEELTFSQLAARKGLDNTPNGEQRAALTRLCVTLLEPARALLGVPLHVDSGYRAPAINLAVGGAANSAHMEGRAADVIPIGIAIQEAFDRLRFSALPFDQLITECDACLHLAVAPANALPRGEVLAATGGPGRWSYVR